ncbi:MAG: helix-turn-helix transcriptional regulator, partial [Alphaproteobacteria bacterium]|nr:helix-turn-helix transcriptional regulator [Alphaproteobacteria bacterium]
MRNTPDQQPLFGRRETVGVFRARFLEALENAGLSRSALARQTGVDRSTLSQLLSPDNDRLPR